MQNTPNYNFLLPEGTDIVNPLVDMNPNWSSLDTALKAVDFRTISRATEVVTGTVHTITRNNNLSFFSFAAVADWKAGDTFIINPGSISVAPITTQAEPLAEGAYKTGARILCYLDTNNTCTVFVSNDNIPNATEIPTTDGNVQSDIDGLKSDVSSIKRLNYIDVTDTTDSNGRITIGSTYFDDPVYNILSAVPIDSHNNIVVEIGKRYAALDSTVAYLFCKYGIDGAAVPNTEITIRIWYVDAQ